MRVLVRALMLGLARKSLSRVRSSGTAEDLEGASFAGLHDTYLDIRDDENLLDAVKRCWASMWTVRAVSYRQTQGFDHFTSSIAMVVQTMVESEVSGVMFTANPINTATDQIVINASWGLGEAIVGHRHAGRIYRLQQKSQGYQPRFRQQRTSDHPRFRARQRYTTFVRKGARPRPILPFR